MSVLRRRVIAVVKLLFAGLILFAVGRQFAHTLSTAEFDRPPTVRWEWLPPAGLLYLAAHTIWGTFWWQLLRHAGVRVSWAAGVRVYFVSQFGKYIPGKAWVIGIRVVLLHHTPGCDWKRVTGLAFVETLTNMAAGALLAVVLVPWAGGAVGRLGGVLPPGWSAAGVLLIPLFPWAIGRLARLRRGPDAPPVRVPPAGLLCRGLLQSAGGWCLLGLSLRCAMAAVLPDLPAYAAADFVSDLADVTAAYLAGFVILVSPGGLGPRELVLQEMLTPRLTELTHTPAAAAVFVAVALRLVWSAFEATAAGLWYLLGRGAKSDAV